MTRTTVEARLQTLETQLRAQHEHLLACRETTRAARVAYARVEGAILMLRELLAECPPEPQTDGLDPAGLARDG